MLRKVVATLALLALAWAKKQSPVQFLAPGKRKEAAIALLMINEQGRVEDKVIEEEKEYEDAGEDSHRMMPEQSLAGVWQNNAQVPVWKVLQQQLLAQYGHRQLPHYTAATVPATLVYAMSAQEQKILEPARRDGKGELNIHLIGSTYRYEGLSDWNILARASPPDMHTVNVHLILGSPFGADGNVQDKRGAPINFDDQMSEDQVPLQPSLLQNPPKKTYGAKELRSKTCRNFTHGSTTVNVHCHEKLYQNVMNEVPLPHLAFMSNPGFPLPFRRFYDGVLIHLLDKSVPSVISAEVALNRDKMEELVAARGDKHAWSLVSASMNEEQWGNEAYQCSETVKSYGATVNVQASPFPYAYHDDRDGAAWIVKNAVVEFFSGRAAGAPKIEMLAAPENDMEDDEVEQSGSAALVNALRVPVSQPFAQAMLTWARQEAKACVDAETVKDWVECCNFGC